MKAFIASCVAAVAIAIVAALIFGQLGMDTTHLYASSNVRL